MSSTYLEDTAVRDKWGRVWGGINGTHRVTQLETIGLKTEASDAKG